MLPPLRLMRWRELPLLIRGSATSMVGLGLSQAATIAVEATVARQLGATDLGILAIGATLSSIFTITIVAGCVVAVGRSVALADETGEASHTRTYLLAGLTVAAGAGIAVAAMLLNWREFLSTRFGAGDAGENVIALFALALPFQAGTGVALAANRALGRVAADAVSQTVDSSVRFIAVPGLLLMGFDIQRVALTYLVASALALPFALAPVISGVRSRAGEVGAAANLRGFAALAGWQVVGAGIWAAARRADLLALSVIVGPAAAGAYRLALLFASVGAVVQSSLQPIFIPVSTRRFARGGRTALVEQYRTVTRVTVLVSAPVYATFIAAAGSFMAIGGPAFRAASIVLVVLCVGFALDVAAGPATAVLTVAGFAARSVLNLAIAFCGELVLLTLLIPAYGAIGAAIALAATFVVVESLQIWAIATRVGGPVTDARLVRSITLMLGLLLAAIAIFATQAGVVALGLLVVSVAIFGVLAMRFAVTPDDIMAIRRGLDRA